MALRYNPSRRRYPFILYSLTSLVTLVFVPVDLAIAFALPANQNGGNPTTLWLVALLLFSPFLYFVFILFSYLEKSRRIIAPSVLLFCLGVLALIIGSAVLANKGGGDSTFLIGYYFLMIPYLIYLFIAGLSLVRNAPCASSEGSVLFHALAGPFLPLVSLIVLSCSAHRFANEEERKEKAARIEAMNPRPLAEKLGISGIFISYRRKDGMELARNIRYALKEAQIADCAFFDVESIGEGSWNEQIKSAIAKSNCFLILLTPSSLENRGENDYFLREVRTILEKDPSENRVIPILAEQFHWPEHLESPLKELAAKQDLEISGRYFDASMARMIDYIKGRPHP